MVEVTENYRGQRYLPQAYGLFPVSIGLEPERSGHQHLVLGLAAFPGNAAFFRHLFQVQPHAMVGQDHGEAGGSAFHSLHLLNYWHFRFFGDGRLPDQITHW